MLARVEHPFVYVTFEGANTLAHSGGLAKREMVLAFASNRLPLRTFVLPPEPTSPLSAWPHAARCAWPPYVQPLGRGEHAFIRKSRSGPAFAQVVESDGDELLVLRNGLDRSERVPRRRAERVHNSSALLLCEETDSFRKLARSQVLPADGVLEVGCSSGHATALLARGRSVLAIDVAEEQLQAASERCAHLGNVRFEQLDALMEPERLVAAAAGVDAIFVDINGNRAAATVAPLLQLLCERVRPAPRVTVVKCRALCRAANRHEAELGCGEAGADDSGALARSAEFWAWVWAGGAAEADWETRSLTRRTTRGPPLRWPEEG